MPREQVAMVRGCRKRRGCLRGLEDAKIIHDGQVKGRKILHMNNRDWGWRKTLEKVDE